MIDLALTALALFLFGCLAMLWYVNENLARVVNALNRIADTQERK
jgi:hypothetical protein